MKALWISILSACFVNLLRIRYDYGVDPAGLLQTIWYCRHSLKWRCISSPRLPDDCTTAGALFLFCRSWRREGKKRQFRRPEGRCKDCLVLGGTFKKCGFKVLTVLLFLRVRFGFFFCDEHEASIFIFFNFVSSDTFGVFRRYLDCTARIYFGFWISDFSYGSALM